MRKRSVPVVPASSAFAVRARIRQKFQLTLPEAVASALAVAPDDGLVFESDPTEPGVVRIRKARASWAGALPGVFGTEEEVAAFLAEERASWGA
jgi:hypothetical protein